MSRRLNKMVCVCVIMCYDVTQTVWPASCVSTRNYAASGRHAVPIYIISIYCRRLSHSAS